MRNNREDNEMQQELESQLHEQYAINNNSNLSSVVTLFTTLLAVLYGYGYVFIHSSIDFSFCNMYDSSKGYSLDALVFVAMGAFLVVAFMERICIYQGYGQRFEQFITYAIRYKYYYNKSKDESKLFPNEYIPFKSKDRLDKDLSVGNHGLAQGLFGEFLNIFFCVRVIIFLSLCLKLLINVFCRFNNEICLFAIGEFISFLVMSFLCYCMNLNFEKEKKKRYLDLLCEYSTIAPFKVIKEKKSEIMEMIMVKDCSYILSNNIKICSCISIIINKINNTARKLLFLFFLVIIPMHLAAAESLSVENESTTLSNSGNDNISFADPNVKAICVANWDTNGDGELSYEEAAAVTDLGKVFYNNTYIKSFDELQNFTKVFSIGGYAFYNCSSLASITIPNSVNAIGGAAFASCSSLASITIPNSVNTIDVYAFFDCSSLASITIPNSVNTIGEYAFASCSSLASITIPKSVNTIGEYAFAGCSSLSVVTVENGNITYDSRNNCNAIIETSTNCLIVGCKNTVIPNSVTSIGNIAFNYCSGLTSIIIPNSVTSIGNTAFNYCSGLTSISVEDENTVFDSRDNCNAIIETATNTLIVGCKNTIIPNSVTSIGANAFWANVNHFTIPSWITYIGENAFSCTMVEVESTVPINIHKNAFNNYKGAVLYVPKGCIDIYSQAENWNQFKKIVEMVSFEPIQFEDPNVKKICVSHWDLDGDGELCYNEAVAAGSVGYVFENNNEITSFNELKYFTRMSTIFVQAFVNCQSLKSITIPNSVTSIGRDAFHGCSNLTSINIPNSVTNIGVQAFYGCYYLDSVTLPNSLTSIEDNLFAHCQHLKAITIPESVTSIGIGAFYDCTKLSFVTIGNSVKTIETGAFSDCYSLKTINFPSSLTTIKNSVFVNCKNLEFAYIPNSVTSLGDKVFSGCEKLKSVCLPNSLKEIGAETFNKCSALAAITWDADIPMTNEMMGAVDNPNLLFYTRSKSCAPTGVNNVIVNGTAEEITLSDTVSSNNFYCPTEFTAEKISYTHKYEMQSGIDGKAQGWETIALPFSVTEISHESKGKLLPFGKWNSSSSEKPFWLCNLSSSGFTRATSIQANTPYIICMPNNSDYDSSFNLSGNVTYSATNAKVSASNSVTKPKSNGKTFIPAFCAQDQASTVYALNVNNSYHSELGGYTEGSAFVSGLRKVSPFEAYMTTDANNAKRAFVIEFSETTGIGDVPVVGSKGKIVVYNMAGQQVTIIDEAHFREVKNQLPSGVYIVNGKKQVIR